VTVTWSETLLVALWHAIEKVVVLVSGSVAAFPESALAMTPLSFETAHDKTPLVLQKMLVREPEETIVGDAHMFALIGPRYCGVLVACAEAEEGDGGGVAG
jgi:hypothetical protein